jgi:hypothetical protein
MSTAYVVFFLAAALAAACGAEAALVEHTFVVSSSLALTSSLLNIMPLV